MPRMFTYSLLAFTAVQNAITRSFDYREDSETLSARPHDSRETSHAV